ncbi:MAG: glucans biosynthesis glucosyltransferase MdoH [Rhodobacterales bacterium]
MTAFPHHPLLPTPDKAPLEMPTQDLRKAPARQRIWQTPQVYLARITAFGGAAALTIYGFMQMNLVFGNETSTTLQSLLLGFFTVTFGWIALSSTQALAAVFSGRREVANESSDRPLTSRTAIIMPVYNEDPATTCAALQAIGEAIADRGEGSAFEIFLLSDTTDPAVWAQETACFSRLRQGLKGKMQVWYRRRFDNVGRKAGNLREFVEQWGARYDHMLVLDADSLMAADTVITLARRMEAAPRLGILQSVPVLMGGTTVFARIQQFAGRVYGPIIARGVSAWQGLDGNYWGHNAIIRVKAFAECCGMPELPGRKPFGGHVMSHDFVEAALIRRGGWQVRMDTDLGGSWEGAPQSLLDLAARDRRWAQGNLQHVKVVGARGLSASNRAHFLIGWRCWSPAVF